MRAFALAAAVALMAGQAGAATFYGSYDGIVPPEYYGPQPPSGAEITIYTRDEWKSAHIFVRSMGRFSMARLDLEYPYYVQPFFTNYLTTDRRTNIAHFSIRYDSSNPDFEKAAKNASLTWCYFGCEWGPMAMGDDGKERWTRVEDGNPWQLKYIMGQPVPVPLPAAAPLLLAGTAALYAMSRRRKA